MVSSRSTHEVLRARGILDAALQAGVTEFIWNQTPGLAIPLYNEFQQVYRLPDGRSAQHWKNLDSNGVPKYLFGYPDSPKGQGKPKDCDIYIPNVAIQAEIAAAGGLLYIACGEPDTWTLLAAGYRNVISLFGEGNILGDFVQTLQRWGVTHVPYYPDLDATGQDAGEKLARMLAPSGIAVKRYALPAQYDGHPIKDINDFYCALQCDAEAFRRALDLLPMVPPDAPGPAEGTKARQDSSRRTGNPVYSDLPTGFYDAIEQALGVTSFQASGWSQYVACPFGAHEHDGKRPKARWHRDMHILHCHKHGETWLAIPVGEVLGLDWHDYIERPAKRQQTGAPGEATGDPTATGEPTSAAPNGAPRQRKPTDDEVGESLIVKMNGQYAYFWEQWYCYDAGCWRPTDNLPQLIWEAMRAAKVKGYEPSKGKRGSVEDYLCAQLRVPAERIDAGNQWINLSNGLWNLETGQLEPHRPECYLTSQLPFAYDAEADCPLWKRCLDQWLVTADGKPDADLQRFLQEAIGYSLTVETQHEAAFWLYGPAGSGKSTVIKVIQSLLGNAHIHLDLGSLESNRYQLADLLGRRVATCTEAPSNSQLVDGVFKQIVSGEEIQARRIYCAPFPFIPTVKIWWAMNERPQNNDRSHAVYRRLRILPLNGVIAPDQKDVHLSAKLKQELPGIFNMALMGLRRLRENGKFTDAVQIGEQVEAYQTANDVEAEFLADAEYICRADGVATKAGLLYVAYAAWCRRFGYKPKSRSQVAEDWLRLGLIKDKRNDCNYYFGVGLVSGESGDG